MALLELMGVRPKINISVNLTAEMQNLTFTLNIFFHFYFYYIFLGNNISLLTSLTVPVLVFHYCKKKPMVSSLWSAIMHFVGVWWWKFACIGTSWSALLLEYQSICVVHSWYDGDAACLITVKYCISVLHFVIVSTDSLCSLFPTVGIRTKSDNSTVQYNTSNANRK